MKIEYYLIHSCSNTIRDERCLELFIGECISIFERSIGKNNATNGGNFETSTDRLLGDDAALLAAMGLIQLYNVGHHTNALLRAIAILQFIVSVSPSNCDALVMLAILYTKFGAGWLAAQTYSRLSVKNIQHPTVSWILTTRLSTIHPFPPSLRYTKAEEKAESDPVYHLMQALRHQHRLEDTDQQELADFLDRQQYAQLLRGMQNSDSNSKGFTKYMLLVELARIERLSGSPPSSELRNLARKRALASFSFTC